MRHATLPIPPSVVAPAFFSAQVAHSRRFYFGMAPAPKALTVACGGLEICAPDYAIRRDGLPFFCLEYVVAGSGWLKLGEEQNALSAGRVFAYGPGTALEIGCKATDPFSKYFVCFSGNRAEKIRSSILPGPDHVAQVYPSHALAPLFEEMIQAGVRGGSQNSELCVHLLDCLALKIAASAAPLTGPETVAFATYQRCRRHIEQNFLSLHSLTEAAAACRVTEAYLCRLFRRYEQTSPYQFLLRLKMHHAATLLQQSDALVKQVAESIGFSDTLHFSRVFRKTLGLPPTRFRGVR